MFSNLKKIDFYKKLLIEWNRLLIVFVSVALLMSAKYISYIYQFSKTMYPPKVFHIISRTTSFQYLFFNFTLISTISFLFWISIFIRHFPRRKDFWVSILNTIGFLCFPIFTLFYPLGGVLFYSILGVLILCFCNIYYQKTWKYVAFPVLKTTNKIVDMLKFTNLFILLQICITYNYSIEYMNRLTYPKSEEETERLVNQLYDLPIVDISSYPFQNLIKASLFLFFLIYLIFRWKYLLQNNWKSFINVAILSVMLYNISNFYLLNPFLVVLFHLILFINPKIDEVVYETFKFFSRDKK